MGRRDLMLLTAGLLAGAALGLMAPGHGERESVSTTRAPVRPSRVDALPEAGTPASAPAPSHGPTVPPSVEPAAGRKAEPDAALAAIDGDLDLLRSLPGLEGAAGKEGRGFRGNAFAGKDPASLADLREEAAKEVERLLDRWRLALPGAERAEAMKALRDPMRRLLETGGSMEHLLILEESAERGETPAERRWAVIATHTLWQPEAVDFLLARARSPHVEVRFYAVEGLAWVRGDDQARAMEGVIRGLEDGDAGVRGIAAASLGAIAADPDRAVAILDRLDRETDPDAARAMARAVLRLDRERGRERLEVAAASAAPEVRAAVSGILAGPR